MNEDLVKELARFEPLRVVFRDTGFVSDAVKINVEQIFKQMSPGTEVKAILRGSVNPAELNALLTSLIATWENEIVEFKQAGNDYKTDKIGEYFSCPCE
ncbi:MAG: hypothetical protein R3F53_18230 [Gammaproteobacteria bacterium]